MVIALAISTITFTNVMYQNSSIEAPPRPD